MSKNAQSVEDLFSDMPAPKKAAKQAAPKAPSGGSLEDLFNSSMPEKRTFTPEELKQGKRDKDNYVMAPISGIINGVSMGYAPKIMPDEMRKEDERLHSDNPVSYGVGELIGGIAPGLGAESLVTKGLGKVFPSLARTGFRSGAATGFLQGAATNPGEDGSRVNNAVTGTLLGGGIGKAAEGLGSLGRRADIYDTMNGPSAGQYQKEVKSKIDQALSDLMAKEVAPRAKELSGVLKGKSVELNPDYLRGFERDKLVGSPGKKGGLDRLADLLESRSDSQGSVPIKAKTGQRLKQYMDQVSSYSAQRPFSEAANATNDSAKYVADNLRRKLEGISPRVSELNEPMSEALNLRNQVKKLSEGNPLGTVSTNPMSDKGAQLKELDRLAGSDLSGLGADIAGAKKMNADVSTLGGLMGKGRYVLKKGAQGVGSVSRPVSRVLPTGSKEALLQLILNNMNQSTPDEGEE